MRGEFGAEAAPPNTDGLVEIVKGNAFAPFGATSSAGVEGMDIITLASSELASTSSGGSRSFSMSDLRLENNAC